jgi:lipoxygenase
LQVFKLMKPHCKGTLMMNAFGRSGLIHAAKSSHELALEAVFTPGKYLMEMASAVYGATWRYDEQHLEVDLIKRWGPVTLHRQKTDSVEEKFV